jgi:hypothetical protein
MLELKAIAPKSKAAPDRLTGRAVELPDDRCKCGSNVAVVDSNRQLNCRSCGHRRGFLSAFTANWIAEVIATVGADTIAIRGPKL